MAAARYDQDRLGIVFRASPRQSDIMIGGEHLPQSLLKSDLYTLSRWYFNQQDGTCPSQGLRPNARATLGHFYGLVR